MLVVLVNGVGRWVGGGVYFAFFLECFLIILLTN